MSSCLGEEEEQEEEEEEEKKSAFQSPCKLRLSVCDGGSQNSCRNSAVVAGPLQRARTGVLFDGREPNVHT